MVENLGVVEASVVVVVEVVVVVVDSLVDLTLVGYGGRFCNLARRCSCGDRVVLLVVDDGSEVVDGVVVVTSSVVVSSSIGVVST